MSLCDLILMQNDHQIVRQSNHQTRNKTEMKKNVSCKKSVKKHLTTPSIDELESLHVKVIPSQTKRNRPRSQSATKAVLASKGTTTSFTDPEDTDHAQETRNKSLIRVFHSKHRFWPKK